LRAQLLDPPHAARTALEVVARVVGLQAQDALSARLGIRSRTTGLTVADVERERLEDRSFVRAWAMRYTIHLVPSNDFPWIRDLVAPPHVAASRTRMAQEGLSPEDAERARRVIRKLLDGGPVTRAEMREEIARKGIAARGRQAWVHLLGLMTYEGEIVTGPYVGKQETMVLLKDWLPGKTPRPPKDPAAELARRYLLGQGPATIDDFRWWSSLRAADARAGFAAIGDELIEESPGLWRHRSQRKSAAATKTVHLLPSFDHYYLGYRDRSHVVTSAGAARMSRGGFFFNFVASDGGAVALWKLVRRKDGYEVVLEPFARLPARAAIEREVADVGRFLEADVSLS
jgi:hypothetical protein